MQSSGCNPIWVTLNIVREILVTPESDRVWIVVGRLLVLCLSFKDDQFLNLVTDVIEVAAMQVSGPAGVLFVVVCL